MTIGLAPALIISASLSICLVAIFIFGLVQDKRLRHSLLTTYEARLKLVTDSVDNIPTPIPPSFENATSVIDQIVSLSAVTLIYIGGYMITYLAAVHTAYRIWPDLNESQRHFINAINAIGLSVLSHWIVFPIVERWLIFSAPTRK